MKYFQRFKRKMSISLRIEILILNAEKLKLTYDCYILSILIMGCYALNVFLVYFSHQNLGVWCPYRQNELDEDLFCF